MPGKLFQQPQTLKSFANNRKRKTKNRARNNLRSKNLKLLR